MEQQAATYLFQQAPSVVIAILVAGVFALAIRALFRDAKEERTAAAAALAKAQDDCKIERAQDRAEFLSQVKDLGAHVGAMAEQLSANTRAIERVADRMAGQAPPAVRAV